MQPAQGGPSYPHNCNLLGRLGNTSQKPHVAFRRLPVNTINQTLHSIVPFADAVQHKFSVFSTRSITVAVTMRNSLV